MIFKEVLGNLHDLDIPDHRIEKVALEWFELDKRLLCKTTDKGNDIGIAVEGRRRLRHGDILFLTPERVIAVEVLPTKAIVLEPRNMPEMAQVCYQLGNRHAPLYMSGEQILVPFDQTIVELFERLNIPVKIERRRLEHGLRPESPHHH
ncbi:UreE urease accessory domain-containing protein [Thermincola ferriacetica]|uniref:Urease accessory protein UreE n=2 Tax=Thermincola TaxID=278993 RepID=D5XBT3_THEPJ|nr:MULTISPECIES: urease accessory protein UreE [Thermincola]ADG81481.1 UreE urease accessory domain protein [Thermincola potens JR]KNZ68942.1 UreE urease accessory domain-containing protein [Thermincola ferriacetica]